MSPKEDNPIMCKGKTMLKYLILLLLVVFSSCKEADITINHNQSILVINGKTYKSSIIMKDTEYQIIKDELILSNHYYTRNQNSEYFIFNKHSLSLKKYLEIGCDNFTQICTGSLYEISSPLHISKTEDENFLDTINDCNIEFMSAYPSDNMTFKEVDALNYRKVTYKINNKVQTFLYDTSYNPNRMYVTKRHTLYIPLCKVKSRQVSILECNIIDGDFRSYSNINCKKVKNEKYSK